MLTIATNILIAIWKYAEHHHATVAVPLTAMTSAAAGWFTHVQRVREQRKVVEQAHRNEMAKLRVEQANKLATMSAEHEAYKKRRQEELSQQTDRIDLLRKATDLFGQLKEKGASFNDVAELLSYVLEFEFRSLKLLPSDPARQSSQASLHISILFFEFASTAFDRAAGRKMFETVKPFLIAMRAGCTEKANQLRSSVKAGVLSDDQIIGIRTGVKLLFSKNFEVFKTIWASAKTDIPELEPQHQEGVARLFYIVLLYAVVEHFTGRPIPDVEVPNPPVASPCNDIVAI